MQHFISVLEQYTQIEVIQTSWTIFKQNLAHQTIFEDLIKLHNEFLDTIKRQSVDIIQLKDLLQMILSVNLQFYSSLDSSTNLYDLMEAC